MKRILCLILGALFLFSFSFVTGCQDATDSGEKHICIYNNVKFDSANHWNECSCGEKIAKEQHSLVKGKCDCGYIDPDYTEPSTPPNPSNPNPNPTPTPEPEKPNTGELEINSVELAAYISKTITTNSTTPTSAIFKVATESEIPSSTGFEYAYYYKKGKNVRSDLSALFVKAGNLKTLKFDLFVKSATSDTVSFSISGGKFITVTEVGAGTLSVVDGAYPSVVLSVGKTYHIEIDYTDVGNACLFVSYKSAVELYYSNFKFVEGQEMDTSRTVVYRNTADETCYQEGKSYFAWPSVTSIGGDRMLAVCSGFRSGHRSPDGQVVGFLSEDGGTTWGNPFTIVDTPLDDRDAGVIFWKNKIIVTWFTHTKDFSDAYKAHWDSLGLDDSEEAKYLGPNSITGTINPDGTISWGKSKTIRIFSPHGIIEDNDGNLVYVGYYDYDKTKKAWTGIGMMKSTDGENWTDFTIIADPTTMAKYKFNEPHAVVTKDNKLVVVLRSEHGKGSGIYQCESTDGGKTFSDFKYIVDAPNTPPHILKMSDGTLVLTYGSRGTTALYSSSAGSRGEGLVARVSYDNAKTWSQPLKLSNESAFRHADYSSGDIGYSCSAQRADGSILTVYYSKELSTDSFTSIISATWKLPKKENNPVITFELDGGTGTQSISGAFGSKMTAPKNPTKANSLFDGWYADKDFREPFEFTNFYTSRTVYAKWISSDIELKGSSTYLKVATDSDLEGTGYTGNSNAWIYTKAMGKTAGPGNVAQMYMDVDSRLMTSVTFSFYIKSYSYKNNTTACHLEVDGAKDSVVFKDSSGKIIQTENNLNTDKSIKGVTAYVNVGEWYTVTVQVTDGVTRINPFSWTNASVTMILTDIKAQVQ